MTQFLTELLVICVREEMMTNKTDAEKICEWLGLEIISTPMHNKPDVKVGEEYFECNNWLSSDSGTVAMIEKLLREYGIRSPLPWLNRDGHPIIYGVQVLGRIYQEPSLNAAMQTAIIELIGGVTWNQVNEQ